MNWTKPYCGVQHLNGLPAGWQISVEDHGSFTDAYVLCLRAEAAFTPVQSARCSSAAAARAWGEEQARVMHLVKEQR